MLQSLKIRFPPTRGFLAMIEAAYRDPAPVPTRVSGVASRAVVRLLADRGVPANELVVTGAQRQEAGDHTSWVVTVLRGRDHASHAFPPELVDKVLAKGPCPEWYTEVGRLLEAAGVAFPA